MVDHPLAGSSAEARPRAMAVRGIWTRADALLVDERRDVLLLRGDECGDESIAGLAMGDGRVDEALVRAKLRPELRLGDPDVRRRRREVRALCAQAVAEYLAAGLVPELRDRGGNVPAGEKSGCRETAGEAEPDDRRDQKCLRWSYRFHASPFPRSCHD